MKVITKSGVVSINRRTHYGKWLLGYMTTGAWSGWFTIEKTWDTQKGLKPNGCSWFAWGVICGNVINPLYNDIRELEEECGRL